MMGNMGGGSVKEMESNVVESFYWFYWGGGFK